MMQNDRRDEEQVDGKSPDEAAPAEAAGAEVKDAPGGEPGQAPVAEAAPEVATYDELKSELDETRERLLRTLAEMENLRRRHAREIEDARKYAITGFARELLDVADNLQRALASVPPKAREKLDLIKNLADGVALTEKTLLGSFERHQIAKVEPVRGEKFDHNRHQAMFEVETDDQPPGTIAQVVQPGYVIADRLLRPAMVGVAKASSRPAKEDGAEAPAADADGAGERPDADARPGERIDTTA